MHQIIVAGLLLSTIEIFYALNCWLSNTLTSIYNMTNGSLLTIIIPNGTFINITMIIRTRVFELASGKYDNLTDLAKAMGLSVSQVYRMREGKRGINEKFIIGAKKAFPKSRLDELFISIPVSRPAVRLNHP